MTCAYPDVAPEKKLFVSRAHCWHRLAFGVIEQSQLQRIELYRLFSDPRYESDETGRLLSGD